MATCDNNVGILNVMITSRPCPGSVGKTYGPDAHDFIGDDLPKIMTAKSVREAMNKGYTKIKHVNPGIKGLKVARLRNRLSESYSRADYEHDVSITYSNGAIVAGKSGSFVGELETDMHEFDLEFVCQDLIEMLP